MDILVTFVVVLVVFFFIFYLILKLMDKKALNKARREYNVAEDKSKDKAIPLKDGTSILTRGTSDGGRGIGGRGLFRRTDRTDRRGAGDEDEGFYRQGTTGRQLPVASGEQDIKGIIQSTRRSILQDESSDDSGKDSRKSQFSHESAGQDKETLRREALERKKQEAIAKFEREMDEYKRREIEKWKKKYE